MMTPFQNYTSSLQSQKKATPFSAPGATASPLATPMRTSTSPFTATQAAKPQMTPLPATAMQPSATSPAKPTIAPVTTTTPAKSAYVDSLGANTGLSESQVRSNLDAYNAKTGSSGNSTAGQQNGSNGTGSEAPADPKSAFLKSYRDYMSQYTSAIKPTADEATGAKKLADIQSKIDERKLYADQEYQKRLDQPGMLKSGAEADAAMFARRENADLANLSVQQGGAARNLLALQGLRQGNMDSLKQAGEAFKPLQIGDNMYDPNTGEVISTKAEAKPASVQEYEYAKKNGYTGTFAQYQNEDANRKAVAAGTNGLTPGQVNTTVNAIPGAFDNEPTVKEYNTIKRNVDTFNNLGSSATDDIQRVYTFAKVADPNSAVKEGEYASIEKYSQAVMQRAGLNVKRVFSATGILTPEARQAMAATLQTSLNSAQKQYDNVYSEYQRQIGDAYSGKPRQITNYGATAAKGATGGTTSGVTPSGIKYSVEP